MRGFAANLGMLWTGLPLLDRVAAAAAAGFDAVEFHWPYDVDPDALRVAAADHGVALLGVNSPPGRLDRGELGFAAVEGAGEAFRAGIDQALDYCRAAGARAIHVMAGNVGAARRAAARPTFVANLRWAADRAADAGVALLVEPLNGIDHPDYFLCDVDQAAGLLAEIDRPSVSIQFDSYHVGRQGQDATAVFARFRDAIGHVQIAACPDRAEPDHGTVDHRAFVRAIAGLGYAGWIAGEYRPRAAVEAGLGWLAELRDVLRPDAQG
ncbi:TIM barrel protein [Sphingomonas sp. YL-JM2C]